MKITKTKSKLIDWDKQQLVISKTNKTIVLTDGLNEKETFSGLCLNYGDYIDNPHYSDKWGKSNFIIYDGNISND